jgi:hypothetical protein
MGYSYAVVEQAFAAVFRMRRPILHGRIAHLRRLGLVLEYPGKGARVAYQEDTIDLWYLALVLTHLRLDPVLAVEIIKANQIQLRRIFALARQARCPEDHIIMMLDFSVPLNQLPQISYRRAGQSMPWQDFSTAFDLSSHLMVLAEALDSHQK